MSYYKIIIPTAATNLCTNTSFEVSTAGWSIAGTNTLAQASTESWTGNYSALCTYQDSTSLAIFNITLPTTTASYKLHGRINVPAAWDGGNIYLTAADMSGASTTGVNIYTDGTDSKDEWLYIETTLTVAADAVGSVRLLTSSAPTAGRGVYLDAVNITEGATVTTHIDGGQPGCYWTGAEHLSTSTREVTSRAGGEVKDLQDDYSVYIERAIGLGTPPLGQVMVDRAQLPGKEHQRVKVAERYFSLVHSFLGSSVTNLHALRQALLDVIKPDAVPGNQPVVFEYQGAAVPKRIHARYAAGMELTLQGDRGFSENIGLQFVMSEPFMYGLGEEKVNLAPTSGTVRLVTARQRGTWNVLGPPSATTASYTGVQDILVEHDKSVYVCGEWTDFDDIAEADYIVHWDGEVWEALGTVTSGSASISSINDMSRAADGTVYAVGNFTSLAGLSGADYLAQWEGGASWAIVEPDITSTASVSNILAAQVDAVGGLYVGGTFTTAGGVSGADNIAYWDGAVWSALTTGTNTTVNDIAITKGGVVLVGGAFTTAGGTAVNYFAGYSDGAWSGYNSGFNAAVIAVLAAPDGRIFAGGSFTQSAGGDTLNRIAEWNGAAWEPLGTGVNGVVYSLSMDSDGLLWVGGAFTQAGSLTTADRLAIWDGSAWRHPPIDLPGSPSVRALATANSDDVWIGFDSTGTAYFSQPTAATNTGTRTAYPIITIKRSGGSSTLTLEEIVNVTTGRRLLFDLDLQDGEEITIDLRPGQRSMTSNFNAGINTSIKQSNWRLLPGSDVTSFNLLPGSNSLAVYTSPSAPSELSVFVRWVPTFWSID